MGEKHTVYEVTRDEYEKPIRDPYLESLARLSYAELDDKYNPGPTLPDGSVNFECHCVAHLVASPCGYEFREALTCQKRVGESALEEGECAEEFMNFMRCVIRTECFKGNFFHNCQSDPKEEGDEDEEMNQKAKLIDSDKSDRH
ncbi:unnamed protein product [Thelazia callipaeda]|uniref:CHCH domain-containing protein n=1 Tax=Thelazia callipaeda TaxID=103827 RepID=A0A0N5CKI4_THECL|nr:unnamed protein product [Thelazia callipaeda]